MEKDPFDQSGKDVGGLDIPNKGIVGIPKDTEKAKQTNAPVIRTETKEAATADGKVALHPPAGPNKVDVFIEQPRNKGTELTDMMRAPKKNDFLAVDAKSKQEILNAYGGVESNIPMTHPTYWNL